MDYTFQDKTLVVIGGTSGIGKQVAINAAKLGAKLILSGRTEEKLNTVSEELIIQGFSVETRILDAHNRDQLNHFFDSLPPFDYLVSMIGDVMGGGILEPSEEMMRHVIESKFFTNLAIAKLAAKKVNYGGSIIFTSGSGGSPSTASASYIGNNSVKALVEGLAKELAPKVRVNTVAPFWMLTPFWRDQPKDQVEATEKYMSSIIPLGRTGTIEEVASAYIFLLQNTFITGQQIFVDGGVQLG
ncbi:MAG: short-chain dehydrogenase [Pseudopedobacter saltans]|uniref:Short-chain dehydrogenase n=1 Tax=Pseudopedobacter saltans TaxID=151895 RepID=A0A2W5EUX8_9SPHI|nr:MAG: short-chain dehydrogenase [Pseudopedobacter saltans]